VLPGWALYQMRNLLPRLRCAGRARVDRIESGVALEGNNDKLLSAGRLREMRPDPLVFSRAGRTRFENNPTRGKQEIEMAGGSSS